MSELRVGLIGAGVFAGYHAQKIVQFENAVFMGVFDLNPEAAQAVVDKVGAGEVVEDIDTLILVCDAIMIATPATTHAQLASRVLRAGRHVFVEKPLALTGIEADTLVALADEKGATIQVGHQERFVFEAMGILGAPEKPLSIEAVRAAPRSPTGRCEDVSVVFDLMVHDIDLANAVFDAKGSVDKASGKIEHSKCTDEAHAEIQYEGGGIAKFTASRCAPERKRTMKIVYPSGVVEIDFLARTVKNETGFDIKLDVSDVLPDPLQKSDFAFFHAAIDEVPSPISGEAGARAAALAEAVENAISKQA